MRSDGYFKISLVLVVFALLYPSMSSGSWNEVFFDDFDDGNYDGWSVTHPTTGDPTTPPDIVSSPEGYSLKGVGSGYSQDPGLNVYLTYPLQINNADELKVEMRAKSGSNWPNSAWIILISGTNSYSFGDYGEGNQWAQFTPYVNRESEWYNYSINANVWHDFAWTRDADGWWSLSIDGVDVWDDFCQDNRLTSFEPIGIHILRDQSEIEWVRISTSESETDCELIPEEIASMSDAHSGGGVVSYEGKLYVWTGYTNYGPSHYNRTVKMEIYDPDTDTWSRGADIPQVKSQPACFELNGKFYTVGGETNPSSSFTSTVHRYDPDTDTWMQMNNFPRRIWQGEAVTCCGKAYVFGGASGYGMPSSAVHEYNEVSDTWIPKASMLTGVSYPAAVCFENKIWVFGGASYLQPHQPTVITKAIQVYDCATNTWGYCDDMPWKVISSQAIAYDNDIWLFASSVWDEGIGGFVENEYAYIFSPGCGGSGEWTRCAFTFPPPIRPSYNSKLDLLDGYIYFTNIYENDTASERVFKVQLGQITEGQMEINIDIKPESCPNPLNVRSQGVLPVAILGSEDFDVNEIDPVSIQLAGVSAIRSSYEDVATPVLDANDCNCIEEGADGYLDLTLKFDTQEIVDTLGDVNHGDVLSLTLEGVLWDETSIEGIDCIVIRGRHRATRGKHEPFNRADINRDGVVNIVDFAIVSEHWLKSAP